MISCNTENLRIVIVGLGNELLGDDGVGLHAVRELRKNPPAGVQVAEVGTRVFHAQHLIEDADLVIAIDAVRGGGRPGSIYRLYAENAHIQRSYSLHDMGIAGLVRAMPEDSKPCVIILGIEPETIDYAIELSPTVRSALKRVVSAAHQIIRDIRDSGLSSLNEGLLHVRDNK
ncbi:MAG: hydrogenase maturation protease [Sedimentisphaerales bacterium]|nr:hydrogenase maturation protease [Sedimentisphaerales bacterium]